MKTYDVPSLYRYCIVRLSTLATSTFTSALKVLSTVLPDSMFFSLVRMTAPPLPGLWCWNQMTCQSWPSRLSTMPFFRSFVVAMRLLAPSRVGDLGCPWAQPPSLAVIRSAANSADRGILVGRSTPRGRFWSSYDADRALDARRTTSTGHSMPTNAYIQCPLGELQATRIPRSP